MGNGFRIAPRCRADILLKNSGITPIAALNVEGFFEKISLNHRVIPGPGAAMA